MARPPNEKSFGCDIENDLADRFDAYICSHRNIKKKQIIVALLEFFLSLTDEQKAILAVNGLKAADLQQDMDGCGVYTVPLAISAVKNAMLFFSGLNETDQQALREFVRVFDLLRTAVDNPDKMPDAGAGKKGNPHRRLGRSGRA